MSIINWITSVITENNFHEMDKVLAILPSCLKSQVAYEIENTKDYGIYG